jgi:hypothetical protein
MILMLGSVTSAVAEPPVRLPRGTRFVDGRYVVTVGLSEATETIDRELTKAGLVFERIGPYRVRGIEVTRFVSQQPSTSWLAIHLVRKEGRTTLDLVERRTP